MLSPSHLTTRPTGVAQLETVSVGLQADTVEASQGTPAKAPKAAGRAQSRCVFSPAEPPAPLARSNVSPHRCLREVPVTPTPPRFLTSQGGGRLLPHHRPGQRQGHAPQAHPPHARSRPLWDQLRSEAGTPSSAAAPSGGASSASVIGGASCGTLNCLRSKRTALRPTVAWESGMN